MRMRIVAAALLTLALAGTSVAAQEPSEAPESAKKEKKICRTDKATGSLTRRTRICLTEAQWREYHNRTRRGLDEFVSSASGAPKCLGQGAGC